MRLRRGDTIIEVILAVTIFSLVAVGALTIINSGLSMAQRSLEITLVRQQIDSQAEMLRFINQNNPDLWQQILSKKLSGPALSVLDVDTCPDFSGSPDAFFIGAFDGGEALRLQGMGSFQQEPATYARVQGDISQGVSVQLASVGGGTGPGAYDAYVQACWSSPGASRPMTMGTIVRIYEPQVK